MLDKQKIIKKVLFGLQLGAIGGLLMTVFPCKQAFVIFLAILWVQAIFSE